MVTGLVSGALNYAGDILDDGTQKAAAERQPLVHKTSMKLYDDDEVKPSKAKEGA